MANKKFSSKIVQKWNVNFATTPITAGSLITLPGAVPAGVIITDGWVVFPTVLHDANSGDSTTLAIGYTGQAAAFYPATAVAGMDAGVYLKLIPGVINIISGQAITTVDTPAEIVAIARNSGATHGGIVHSAETHIILTAGAGQDINSGTASIFLEYLKY
jgi:hypothetical protein